MNHESILAFNQAKRVLPGGVNSPVRAYKAVNLTPPFIKKGEGAYIYDIDGNSYVDYVLSWGPLILGHQDPLVAEAIKEQVDQGWTYGAPTTLETDLAQRIIQDFPRIDLIRFVNSGTEATMSALRLARGYTGRDLVIKFEGCYHGHADSFLVAAGSGLATFSQADSAGVPQALANLTLSLPYNDIEAVKACFEEFGKEIAGVIIEPVAGNMGTIPADPDFIQDLAGQCKEYGALLIFDEVMSGYRAAYPGASRLYGDLADIYCFGKVIGGGLNAAAYGSRKEIMEYIAPLGPVYQAGTLSGNPLAMVAGKATLDQINPEQFIQLSQKVDYISESVQAYANDRGIPLQVQHIGTMFSFFFTDHAVKNFSQAKACDTKRFQAFFKGMLEKGVYLASSPFETNFISTQHSWDIVKETVALMKQVLDSIVEEA